MVGIEGLVNWVAYMDALKTVRGIGEPGEGGFGSWFSVL